MALIKIKGPAHMAKGGQHLRNRTPPPTHNYKYKIVLLLKITRCHHFIEMSLGVHSDGPPKTLEGCPN